ncbi:MAG: sugar transferase [Clostridia bacterium]|nr:sugar transferase [Clostridia bacterium]
MYKRFFKRFLDIVLSFFALLVLSPVLLVLIIVGWIAMKGNPFFVQPRPGKIDPKTGKEKIFNLVKLRTMTCEKDKEGNLLPDDKRLTRYGKMLRSTSLDELPELWNILKGDMSIVGPRPQLVRDMVFMTELERKRHTATPGLTGLAQVSGRNAITWEKKLSIDLEYIESVTFVGDLRIILLTVIKVFRREDISEEGFDTAEDLGDYLLRKDAIDKDYHKEMLSEAERLLETVSKH